MTDRTHRRYLRFDCDLRAVLERRIGVGTRPDDSQPPPSTAPVTVRCLSASGLGLTFDEWDECSLEPGEPVLIHLRDDGRDLALPGDVAWIRPRPHERFDLGVELRLERGAPAVRDAYLALVRRRGGPGALTRRALSPRAL